MPSSPNQNPTNELLLLYDEFTEFQSQCAFLCDSVVALAMSELVMDKRSVNGLHINATNKTALDYLDAVAKNLTQSKF